MTTPKPGLYQKFNVERIVGQDKEGEEFFVLSPTHDPLAREALYKYAAIVNREGLLELSYDIIHALEREKKGEKFYNEG